MDSTPDASPSSFSSVLSSNDTPSSSSSSHFSGDSDSTTPQHIWVVTGPAGCGKSTVGQYIASAMNYPFVEGDEYHPKSSVEKMGTGIPLTDADRWDWLVTLRTACMTSLSTPQKPSTNAASTPKGVVLACSALKRKYRDVFRIAPYFSANISLHFIYLRASEAVLKARVEKRADHYMHADMVHSQFTALEEPGTEELDKDVFVVGVEGGLEEVEDRALAFVQGTCSE